MKSCYRFPGSKAKLLPQILPFIETSLIGRGSFADLFVGGGSVALAVAGKYPNLPLILNDKDPLTFSFWRLMADEHAEIEPLLELIKNQPTIELYYQLRAEEPKNITERAYRSIFFNRTSFSGDMRKKASPIGGKHQSSQWKVDCRYNAEKLIAQIGDIKKLLSGRTEVYNEDINDLAVLDDDGIAVYLDPPYLIKGHMLYEEHMRLQEHQQLAQSLSKNRNWVLSIDNCEQVREMYDYADIRFIDVSYCIKGKKDNWEKTKELLILPTMLA